MILSYFFLLHSAPKGGFSERALDETVEAFLRDLQASAKQNYHDELTFEIDDAVSKLRDLNLGKKNNSHGNALCCSI